MRNPLILAPLLMLGGCAGYAADYWGSPSAIIAADLPRFGLDSGQEQCVSEGLAASLSVWQLRQFSMAAQALGDGARLAPGDMLRAAAAVEDQRVAQAVERVAASCSITAGTARSSHEASAPAPAARTGSTWINLGAASTGQAIAVDAVSIGEEPPYRRGWFRLTDPGEQGQGRAAYLLRIDCTERSINPLAARRYGASGEIADERSYGPEGEGAMPVESGTVMEIAYLALCT